jgi:hypothetical protein
MLNVPEIDGVSLGGFSEPISLGKLMATRCDGLPSEAGIYLVIRTAGSYPLFLPKSPGGWFKGKDPSDPLDLVQAHWIEGAHVVYIGEKGLKGRIDQLLGFGGGKIIGHRGGRLLWHLTDSSELLLRWRLYPQSLNSKPLTAAGDHLQI